MRSPYLGSSYHTYTTPNELVSGHDGTFTTPSIPTYGGTPVVAPRPVDHRTHINAMWAIHHPPTASRQK